MARLKSRRQDRGPDDPRQRYAPAGQRLWRYSRLFGIWRIFMDAIRAETPFMSGQYTHRFAGGGSRSPYLPANEERCARPSVPCGQDSDDKEEIARSTARKHGCART